MTGVLGKLTRIHDVLTDVSFQLGKLFLCIIVFAYCYEVASRYVFSAPTWWADEAVSYSLSIGCFVMLPHVTREKSHIAVTLLIDALSSEKAKVLGWLIYLVGFLACGLAAWISLDENIRQIVNDVHMMKVVPFPKYWISVWITYGLASSALYFLRFLDYRTISVGGGVKTDGKVA